MSRIFTSKKNYSFSFWLILTLLMVIIESTQSQIIQPDRVEIELNDYDDYYTVISAKEEGLVLVREDDERGEPRTKNWEVLKFNTDLTQAWKRNLMINLNYDFTGYEYRNGKVYLLFKSVSYQNDNMILRVMDLETGDTEEAEINYVFPLNLTKLF